MLLIKKLCTGRFLSRLTISQLLSNPYSSSITTLLARVESIRCFPSISFVHLLDGTSSTSIQALLPKDQCKFKVGDCILVKGNLIKSKNHQQEFDFNVISLLDHFSYQNCYADGLQRKSFPREAVNDDRSDARRMRHPEFAAILRVRSALLSALHHESTQLGCLETSVPCITCNDCESVGETLNILEDYFAKPVNLSVSGQLHLETVATQLYCNVYSISRAFRAQPSVSRFHLGEFDMLECEFTYIKSLDELMNKVETLIKNVIAYLLVSNKQDIDLIRRICSKGNWVNYSKLADTSFERIRFNDVHTSSTSLSRSDEFNILKSANGNAVFVTHFPDSKSRAFYMKRDDRLNALNFDLLFPVCGEIAGGSIRENNYDILKERTPKNLDWYVDLRLDGYPDLAGFGLGVERLLMSLLGLSNVKDAIPFPRWKGQCSF